MKKRLQLQHTILEYIRAHERWMKNGSKRSNQLASEGYKENNTNDEHVVDVQYLLQ